MENFLRTHQLHRRGTLSGNVVTADGPPNLAAMINQMNSDSYRDGFFQFAGSTDFGPYLAIWGLDPKDCRCFIKCAFGQLIFFHREQYKVLNPVYNAIDILGEADELDFVMDIVLCDSAVLRNSFFLDIFTRRVTDLGPPSLEEMYAFVPALGIGGHRDEARVEKVKMYEQMMILAQI